MDRKELLMKRVYELVHELKIPLIDEHVYSNAEFIGSTMTSVVTFAYDDDESVIRGFLGLAEYFHTIVIRKADRFYIVTPDLQFKLEAG
ncbi:MAG: hypothetical protein C4K49_00140 [Candidatus Thorarchaeota archaeon]|nr:MAG: hypothetical protein C4K49_00140 [Candidatus Thorarchaeota archaeon]